MSKKLTPKDLIVITSREEEFLKAEEELRIAKNKMLDVFDKVCRSKDVAIYQSNLALEELLTEIRFSIGNGGKIKDRT